MPPTELVHAAAVFALFGLIWTIQLVHYPMFKFVEAPHWPRFHQLHSRNITFIVFPLMLTELLTAIQLFITEGPGIHTFFLACSAATWLSTIAIFVPLHNQVSNRPLASIFEKLVALNWIRTVIWTLCTIATFVHLRGS